MPATTVRQYKAVTLMDAKAADGIGESISVKPYKVVTVVITAAASPDLTLKMQTAMREADGTAPDFSSAASLTNEWDNVEMIEIRDQSSIIKGQTGLAYTGTGSTRIYAVNVDRTDYLNAVISSYAAGTVTIKVYANTNA